MSVVPVTYYTVVCDGCGTDAFDGDDYSAWADEEQALEVFNAGNDDGGDWLATDDGKHWCPNCGIRSATP